MFKRLFQVTFLALCPILAAQQTMNNDAVLKLVKAGLSDDLIITTVNSSPGSYDTSADAIIALKQGGASEKVIAAILAKSAPAQTLAAPPSGNAQSSTQAAPAATEPAQAQSARVNNSASPSTNGPRVFLQSESKGSQWNAVRDQSMEMSKDFERNCPYVRVTINQSAADYTVLLNHIEHGFARDNQFQVANRSGDLISKTREGGSIASGVKKACQVILDDWAKTGGHEGSNH